MTTRITQLSQTINSNVALIDDHLAQSGLDTPSLDIGAPKKPPTSGDAEATRVQTIAALDELQALLVGPKALLRFDWTDKMSLRIIAKFGIAKLVPVGKEVPYSEIARGTTISERDLRRILRHAMLRFIFQEPREGYVAHTALSQLLAEDEDQQHICLAITELLWPASYYTADALAQWPGSEDPRQTGFSCAFGAGKSMWETLATQPEVSERFGRYIGTHPMAPEIPRWVPWKGKVVDVGGSMGDIMIDLLRCCPEIEEAIVEDHPVVVEKAKEALPTDLVGRLKYLEHDFLTPQPIQADFYFLRWILHNWNDETCLRILRSLIPALKPGARLIINDYLVPKPKTVSNHLELEVRRVDMTMLHLFNSYEREEDDWHSLFRQADARFVIRSVRATPSEMIMSIIEVEWVPELRGP